MSLDQSVRSATSSDAAGPNRCKGFVQRPGIRNEDERTLGAFGFDR